MNQISTLILAFIMTAVLVGCGQKNQATDNNTTTPAATTDSSAAPAGGNAADLYDQARKLRDGLDGVAVDKAKAFELFSKSAEMGNSGAMFFVGVMYETGESVPVDLEKALEWYEKSNKLGCGCAPDSLIKNTKAKIAKAAAKKK